MAKLKCNCGHVIVDQTDDLSYKADIVPDQNFGQLFKEVTQGVLEQRATPARADAFTGVWIANTKLMYQCEVCGRILIQIKGADQYASFMPEDEEGKHIIGRIAANDGTH